MRDRRVWYFGVLAMLLGALDEDALAFLIAYLERDHGLSTAGAVSVAAASVVGALAGFVSTARKGYRPPARAMRHEMTVITVSLLLAVVIANVWVIVVAELVVRVRGRRATGSRSRRASSASIPTGSAVCRRW